MTRLETVERDGLTFDVDDRGPADGPVVLLLHGFPQTRESWAAVGARLVEAGHRVVVPDQRGYSPRARPRGLAPYALPELVADAAAVARAASPGRPVHVVGHDWGAVVAWALAAAHPELVAGVVGVSVPHPTAYLRSVVTSRQFLSSWYIVVFQVPGLAERLLARPGALAGVLRRAGQSAAAARRDVAALGERGDLADVLRAALGWYRALVLVAHRAGRTRETRAVSVPSLLVWSDGDVAISRAAADGNARFVTGPYRLEVLPGVSHWIPDEAPDALADLVLGHVAEVRAAG